ncbi:MAG: hypothetical protein LBE78_10020 [Burkholderiaceae bacterium]|jgi:hypothetical protein|nr:hypothetical protein [Burkholderiaceae bacterium]
MNRCSKISFAFVSIAVGAFLIGVGVSFSSPVWASRVFPEKVQRAKTTFIAIPEVLLGGKPERLAHGARACTTSATLS